VAVAAMRPLDCHDQAMVSRSRRGTALTSRSGPSTRSLLPSGPYYSGIGWCSKNSQTRYVVSSGPQLWPPPWTMSSTSAPAGQAQLHRSQTSLIVSVSGSGSQPLRLDHQGRWPEVRHETSGVALRWERLLSRCLIQSARVTPMGPSVVTPADPGDDDRLLGEPRRSPKWAA
jgi:hypothetical protein